MTREECERLEFTRQVPGLERTWVRSGTRLVTTWFSVCAAEQRARFAQRGQDPVRRWKPSPVDLRSLERRDDRTEAEEAVFSCTGEDSDVPGAPDPLVVGSGRPRRCSSRARSPATPSPRCARSGPRA